MIDWIIEDGVLEILRNLNLQNVVLIVIAIKSFVKIIWLKILINIGGKPASQNVNLEN